MNPVFAEDKFTTILRAYRKEYGRGSIVFLEPSGALALIPAEDDDMAYLVPDDETQEGFAEKLEQSVKAGRNLFFEAYRGHQINPYSDDNALY